MAGIILTLAIQNVLDNHRANEIRDNTIQMSKMEQRIDECKAFDAKE